MDEIRASRLASMANGGQAAMKKISRLNKGVELKANELKAVDCLAQVKKVVNTAEDDQDLVLIEPKTGFYSRHSCQEETMKTIFRHQGIQLLSCYYQVHRPNSRNKVGLRVGFPTLHQ